MRSLLRHGLAAFVLLTVSSLNAQPPQLIERVFGDLKWGMSEADVRKRLAGRVDANTSHDTTLLRDQPRPKRNERILRSRDQFSRSFYFFRAGKLTRLYVVLEPAVFPEGNFSAFVASLEKRLGPAVQEQGEIAPGIVRRWRQWRQGRTRLRALDETQHLGCYVLSYEASLDR